MKKIGIVANLEKPNAGRRAEEISRALSQLGAEVYLEANLAVELSSRRNLFDLDKPAPAKLEALVVLGGDGTIIHTFHHLKSKNLPLLGVNLGGLGFLTEVRLDDLPAVMEAMVKDKLKVEERKTIHCLCLRSGRQIGDFTAINEVAVGRGGLARVIQMEAYLNDQYLTAYMSDGLIVSTPTGSTGYSLSAHGPIVDPGTQALLINPICPHTLTNRPIIISDDSRVSIRLGQTPRKTMLTIDGQVGLPLRSGDRVDVTGGEISLKLLTDPAISYYHILRSKLNWGGKAQAGDP